MSIYFGDFLVDCGKTSSVLNVCSNVVWLKDILTYGYLKRVLACCYGQNSSVLCTVYCILLNDSLLNIVFFLCVLLFQLVSVSLTIASGLYCFYWACTYHSHAVDRPYFRQIERYMQWWKKKEPTLTHSLANRTKPWYLPIWLTYWIDSQASFYLHLSGGY